VKTDLNPYSNPALKPQSNALKRGVAAPASQLQPMKAGQDYQVDLSQAAKAPPSAPAASVPLPSAPLPSVPDLPSLDLADSSKAVAQEVAKEAVKDEAVEGVKKASEVKEEVSTGSLKKPAIIFVSGWQWMFSPSKSEGSYAGVERMAEAVEGARLYGWDQKDEILEHIKKTDQSQPIILVGHSLGGDTVKEVADELDSLKYNFRKVDFLATLDAVGFGNDIIPQNVGEHLNVFGENDFFLNDGPHVARNHSRTKVANILSPLDHTELDDAKDIQFEILQGINKALKRG